MDVVRVNAWRNDAAACALHEDEGRTSQEGGINESGEGNEPQRGGVYRIVTLAFLVSW